MGGKKGGFGGRMIKCDAALATVLGTSAGQKIAIGDMMKNLWKYIRKHELMVKG